MKAFVFLDNDIKSKPCKYTLVSHFSCVLIMRLKDGSEQNYSYGRCYQKSITFKEPEFISTWNDL